MPPREARPPRVRTGPVMGTWASIHVHDDAPPPFVDEAVDAVFEELARLEDIFSTFRPSSEVCRLNRGEIDLSAVSPEVIEVLDACTWLEQVSNGAFDIRPRGLDGPIDPAGFVKGWATERASRRLAAAGLADWYVSVGGDVVMNGRPEPGQRWRVGIADPNDPTQVRATLELDGGAVATSGTSERGHHLWDRRLGGAADALASMTVTGPSLSWADAFATTAFVMGEAGVAWVERFNGYGAVAVRHDGSIMASPLYAHAAA
jgi:thiamine biosynthesis lipoprotein